MRTRRAGTHLSATVVGLRADGHPVTKDASAAARTALEGLAVQLLKSGERRGRDKAVAASTACTPSSEPAQPP